MKKSANRHDDRSGGPCTRTTIARTTAGAPGPRSWLVAAVLFSMGTAIAIAQEPPRFRTSVEVTSLDVSVVDGNGRPIRSLGADAFVVRIDGKPRRVVSAEWISLVSQPKRDAAVVVPEGFSTNENTKDGRIIVIAVDQPHIRTSGAQAVLNTASKFIDRLSPSDLVAVVGFGLSGTATALTADRDRIKEALAAMTGERSNNLLGGQYNIALAEALAINDGDLGMVGSVADRECPVGVPPTASPAAQQAAALAKLRCRAQIEEQAAKLANEAAVNTEATLRSLRDLLERLGAIDAPKTLVLISEGFVLADREPVINELGTMAAAARTSLYALQLDDESLFSVENARRPMAPAADARERRLGLELLAGAARGTLFTTGSSSALFFNQLEAEISGYYLIGVESDPRDRDGRAHPVQIEVPQPGAHVRSRRQMITPADTIRSPRQAVATSLKSPLLLSAVPLRVATFSLQGPERGKVQLLIHADVGKDYDDSREVSAVYTIADRTGRIVEGWTLASRLMPMTNGLPSPLEFAAGASLTPGDYTLKLVVAEGDKVGSVEHPVHAWLSHVGAHTLSELMVGGPTDGRERLRPTIGHTISFGTLHGYFEAYGPQVANVTARYEIATDPQSPALVSSDVPGKAFGNDRMIFSLVMPVNRLPPGTYVLRAIVSAAAKPLTTLTRSFEVGRPIVTRAAELTGSVARSAEPAESATRPVEPTGSVASPSARGASSPGSVLLLSVDEQAFTRPFLREEALTPEALKPFRARLAASVKPAFESGVAFLKAGDYPKAEATLKRAIRPDVDSTAALAYLAATFAASGHDVEASAAWQTALADGSDLPQIYAWLAQSLVRIRRLAEARTILEEAIGKWPSDPRFTGQLATLYATLGEGPEALGTLEQYLKARPDDREALQRAVEWIYEAHVSGRLLRSAAEDLRLAHVYADAYTKAGGPQNGLVGRWVEFLEREKH